MSFCDQCGSSLEDGDKFCTTCGAAVAPSEASAESAETYNAGTYTEQSRPASLAFTPPPEMTGDTSFSSESELRTDPTKKPSRMVVLLISAALAVFFGGVAYGIVHATSNSPSKATSSSASSSSKTTTTTIAPTTTTQPSGKGNSLSPGFSSNVPASLRASILKSQPNLAALDTFVSIVDDPSYPSWVEVCAQDAGPTSPGAANGYANEVNDQWNFTGFGTAWAPPFPLGLTQTIINSFAACTSAPTSTVVPATTTTVPPTTTTAPATTTTTPGRTATGHAVTLGAGTFTGGSDVAVGLYDVTTVAGQSGNFIVTGTDSYDEILGSAGGFGGVPEVRAQISKGDQIQISGLSSVTFAPVTSPLVTNHSTITLFAGTWTVGQDIGPGRYIATTTAGSSGNFIVTGDDEVDEILGTAGGDGVPSVTLSLDSSDVITISGLSHVTMTAIS